MSKIEILDTLKEQIIKDYKNNISIVDLGRKYNINESTLYYKLIAWNVHEATNNCWTQEEVNILINTYPTGSWDEILSLLPGRNKETITQKASKLKIKKASHFWNKQEIAILQEEYEKGTPIKQIVRIFNDKYSTEAIAAKANKLGFVKVSKWEQWEIDYLISNYPLLPVEDICKVLNNRKRNAIRSKAKELGLKFCNTWTDEQVDFLKSHYNDMSDKEIANILGRKWRSVLDKRCHLGLIKDKKRGTYESLDNFLRKQLKIWKKESLRECQYKCVITGQRLNAIHHLYGMNMIIDETFLNLDICIKDSFEDYSEYELEIIKNKFLEIHSKYPLGICLTREIHNFFHKIYGYGYNTPEQFEEFKQRCFKREFNIKIA
jgi:hypothetical protein